MVRRESLENIDKLRNIRHIKDKIKLFSCSLDNALSVYKLFSQIKPDECYNLAANSFVSYSLEDDLGIMNSNFVSTHNILLSVIDVCQRCKVYFDGLSEI